MYYVAFNDHKNKESLLLDCFGDKYNALFYLEDFVVRYIESKHGYDQSRMKIYREPSSVKSMTWNSMPYGYVNTRNINESVTKQTIYKKSKGNGLVYSPDIIEKIFSIDIIYTEYHPQYEITYVQQDSEQKHTFSTVVLPALLNKFALKSSLII